MAPTLHAQVLGAGPTGSLLALAFASAGWRVSLRDPLTADQLLARHRAYAISQSSRRLLQRLGLWSAIEPSLAPFSRLWLQDFGTGQALTFTSADLGANVAADAAGAIGWIAQHRPLMQLLLERLQASDRIQLALGDPDQTAQECTAFDLVLAADGPQSPRRQALAIGSWQHAYGQACLTVQVRLSGCADDTAMELLRPEGPFAVLPLGNGAFQLVWSAPRSRCQRLEQLSAAAFLDQLAGALPDGLQPELLLDRPRSFPVGWQLAHRLRRGTSLLVGESAHRCHPVGGQGLNLCWRDIATLLTLAEQVALGRRSPRSLARTYARQRWLDLLLTLLATDGLVRLFSNRSPLLLPLRRVAIQRLRGWAWLRRFTLAVMTSGPCRPLGV